MRNPGVLLSESFYANPNVVEVSKKLIGKVLCSTIDNCFTAGIITETEAYCGRNDRACHAYNGLRTERTGVMYGNPGHAYIYLCYGIHHMLNVVTNINGMADAVLIRAIHPVEGVDVMIKRRNIKQPANLANGPGKLTQALGVTRHLNTVSLSKPPLWIEDRKFQIDPGKIQHSKRIGIDYAGEDANKLWRFHISSGIL